MDIVDAAVADDEGLPPLRPDAVIVAGATRRGKPCRLIDNTCSQPREILEDLLNDLIAQDHFGPGGFTAAGGNTITLGVPQSAHVQLGENIYRLIVFDYEARIEPF